MDYEFDKEIDVLLRQAARGAAASAERNPKSEHLDADEFAAFAENALPEKAKQKYLLHLADCDACRKDLANLIRQTAEEQSETLAVEEKRFLEKPIPWYRTLFAIPNLVYAMGALVLILSGVGVYTVLQNAGNSRSSEVSQTYEKQPNGKGMSSDGDQTLNESYTGGGATTSNQTASNAASMNSAVNTGAANSSLMPGAMANSNVSAPASRNEANKNSATAAKPAAPLPESLSSTQADDVAAAPPPTASLPVNGRDYTAPPLGEAEKQASPKEKPRERQPELAENRTDAESDAARRATVPTVTMRAQNKDKKLQSPSSGGDAADKSDAGETASVGGKTFKRANGVWYDQAYRGQATVNVARGTEDYKKLDAGLRRVAENLGGTVVVLWKQKAYRIQ